MIQVLICDDQEMVREGLRAILGTAPGIEVVGVAEDGAQAVELVQAQQPAVVLMDLNMPGGKGFVEYRDRGAVVFVGRHRAQLCQCAVCEIGGYRSNPGGGDCATEWAGRLKSFVQIA